MAKGSDRSVSISIASSLLNSSGRATKSSGKSPAMNGTFSTFAVVLRSLMNFCHSLPGLGYFLVQIECLISMTSFKPARHGRSFKGHARFDGNDALTLAAGPLPLFAAGFGVQNFRR